MLRAQLMRLLSGVNEYAGPEETEIGPQARGDCGIKIFVIFPRQNPK